MGIVFILLVIVPGYLFILLNYTQQKFSIRETGQNLYFRSMVLGIFFVLMTYIIDLNLPHVGWGARIQKNVNLVVGKDHIFNYGILISLVIKSIFLVLLINLLYYFFEHSLVKAKLCHQYFDLGFAIKKARGREYLSSFAVFIWLFSVTDKKSKFKKFNDNLRQNSSVIFDYGMLSYHYISSTNQFLAMSAYRDVPLIIYMANRKYYIGTVPLLSLSSKKGQYRLREKSNGIEDESIPTSLTGTQIEEYNLKIAMAFFFQDVFIVALLVVFLLLVTIFPFALLVKLQLISISAPEYMALLFFIITSLVSYIFSSSSKGALVEEIVHDQDDFHFIPYASGYLDKDTLQAHHQINYSSDSDPMIIMLKRSNIESISRYDEGQYQDELKSHPKDKGHQSEYVI